MRERRSARALPLAGMAAAGMVLAHELAYRLAVPDGQARALQFLVACAGALVLHALGRSAHAVADLLARRWAHAPRTLLFGRARDPEFRPTLALSGAAGPRGPPLV